MRLTIISVFLFQFYSVHAQVPIDSVFLMADKNSEFIEISEIKGKRIGFYIANEPKNWSFFMDHIYVDKDPRNHMKFLIPKDMMQDFFKKGNAIPIEEIKEDTRSLDRKSLYKYIRLKFNPYQYEPWDKETYYTHRRCKAFIFFKQDMDKEYIECYEVSIITMAISID